MNRSDLATRIDELAETPSADALPSDAEGVVEELLNALESGEVRAAERGENGQWAAVPWVKRGILLGFRVGDVAGTGECGISAQLEAAEDSGCCCPGTELISIV